MENFDDFDDFDDGCDGDDFMDDDSEGDFSDDGLNAEMQEDSEQEDNGIDIGWEEIAMFGALSEEFAEERERRKLEKKMDDDQNYRHREED